MAPMNCKYSRALSGIGRGDFDFDTDLFFDFDFIHGIVSGLRSLRKATKILCRVFLLRARVIRRSKTIEGLREMRRGGARSAGRGAEQTALLTTRQRSR